METETLTKTDIAALQGLAEQAGIHAANSLSTLINQEVTIRSVLIQQTKPEKLSSLEEKEKVTSTVTMSLVGALNGYLTLITSKESSLNLADLTANRPLGTTKNIEEASFSVLKEIGNIIGGTFLASLANATGLHIISSPPNLAVGTLYETIKPIIEKFKEDEGAALVFEIDYKMGAGSKGEAEMVVPEININSRFVLVLDVVSLKLLLEHIKE